MTDRSTQLPMTPSQDLPTESLDTEHVESPAKEIEQLFDKVEDYSRTTFELAKLKALDASTTVVTSLAAKLVVLMLAFTFVLILSVGVSIWLGVLLENNYYGFFIVASFFLVLTIIFQQFLQDIIRKAIGQAIIHQALQ